MIEYFLEDLRLIFIVVVFCVVALWYHLQIVSKVLNNKAYGKTKHVLVTGCDSGFGYEIALDLNASECKVFAGCLTKQGVERFKKVKSFDGIPFIMDVTKVEDIETTRRLIEDETDGKGLYAVVNNAGIMNFGPIDWIDINDMQMVMDVNFWGTVRTIKAFLPMIKIAKGRIVNISSLAGFMSVPYFGVYPATKHAIRGFTDSLRNELKDVGVTVHLIEPLKAFKTNILDVSIVKKKWLDLFDKQPEETKQLYAENFHAYLETFLKGCNTNISPNLEMVTEKVNHAVLSSIPQANYKVGEYSFFFNLLSIMPTTIKDWFISAYMIPDLKTSVKSKDQ